MAILFSFRLFRTFLPRKRGFPCLSSAPSTTTCAPMPALLGARILQDYPALHQFDDPVSPWIENLLRKPFPAQTIAIMGLARRWQEARTGMVVAECGTGKTLISLGAIHVHSEGSPFTALAMVPPHLVEKWARESFSRCRECACF